MTKKLITPKQLYIFWNETGIHMGIQTIYKLVKKRDFPSVKMEGRFYIIEEDVDDWVKKQVPKCCA